MKPVSASLETTEPPFLRTRIYHWLHPRLHPFLHRIGTPVFSQLCTFLEAIYLTWKTFLIFFQPKKWRKQEILQYTVHFGVKSLPIIAVSTGFAGLIITHEIAWHMDQALHTVSMVPGFTGQFILRELGVAIPCLLLVSKVGAAITAEVGTMKITDQIDALKLLKIDPIEYLVFPRVLASTLSGACLTMIATAVTLICAIGVAVVEYNFSVREYVNALQHFLTPGDLLCALVKGTLYGALIPIVSCAYGFRCEGGAEGVGQATTRSVVTSSVCVIIFDFVLTYIFTKLLG